MTVKRRSDPFPQHANKSLILPAKKAFVNSNQEESRGIGDDISTDMTSGEDLDKIIIGLREKFKKKAKNEQAKTKAEIRKIVNDTVQDIENKIKSYESSINDKLAKLRGDLEKIDKDREKELQSYHEHYKKMKKVLKGTLKQIKQYDQQYHALTESFFEAAQAIEIDMMESTKEYLDTALVPYSN